MRKRVTRPSRDSRCAIRAAVPVVVAALGFLAFWLQACGRGPGTIEGSVLENCVWVEPGVFRMGSGEHEDRDSDETQHQVSLTHGYYIGRHEVTQAQFQEVMGHNPSLFKSSGLQAPVEGVTWEDAMEFCRRLTERERNAGVLPEGWVYSLPSEAQWEYACRAGTRSRFYFGDDAARLHRYAWFLGNARKPYPVGGKKPNAWGIHDMHGNVWEWCLDWYGAYGTGVAVNPLGPDAGMFRVLRGGSWGGEARYNRSASRSRSGPGIRDGLVGFRVVAVKRRDPGRPRADISARHDRDIHEDGHP